MKLCCFVITVFFGADGLLRVTAGTSAEQAQDQTKWLTLNPKEDDPAAIVAEILGKLKVALEKGGDGIDVTTDGRIILKEPLSISSAATETRGVETAPSRAVAKESLINPNTATEEELRSLPGVGPVIAGRIFASRPYFSVDDLRKVDGIGEEKMADIKPLVTVD
jgi:DNA uptake protein ComE-like DNA-binding protein